MDSRQLSIVLLVGQSSVVVNAHGLWSKACWSGMRLNLGRSTSCFPEQETLSLSLSTGSSQEKDSGTNLNNQDKLEGVHLQTYCIKTFLFIFSL